VKARAITDEYMFGPAFLVAPVTTYQAHSRSVYLPPTTGDWYDFWTGAHTAGGQTIDAPAPYDTLPLFIRAGSIIPFGPGTAIHRRETGRPDHAVCLCGCQRRVHALRG